MKKINKLRLCSILLVLCLLSAPSLGFSSAAASYPMTDQTVYYNPLYNFQCSEDNTYLGSYYTYSSASTFTCSSPEDFSSVLREQMLNRNVKFNVHYTGDSDDVSQSLSTLLDTLLDGACSCDDPATSSDYDYLYYSFSSVSVERSVFFEYAVYKFEFEYLTDTDQEEFVDEQVKEILDGLDVYDASQYEKIVAVHDYICDNVTYDFDLEKYSAYEALYSNETVCQGYALLTYKMLTELNVPVRIITGYGNGGLHAWNIVGIGDLWYNIDVTWDDSTSSYDFFLENDNDFSYHVRAYKYSTEDFYTEFPMSSDNFPIENDFTSVYSVNLRISDIVVEIGQVFTISAALDPSDATEQVLEWSSSDESVASVSQSGEITAVSIGAAEITAASTDGSGKTASCIVTVSEHGAFYTASSWAKSELNSLYFRGVIPEDLLSDYSSSITRGEFTALMVNVYEYANGGYTLSGETPLTDIAGHEYELQIAKGYELGIIAGIGDNLFGPDETLSREQCAKILCTTLQAISGDEISSDVSLTYGDASSISSWATSYVKYAFEFGLMSGDGVNFNPAENLSREQAMAVCERLIAKYG